MERDKNGVKKGRSLVAVGTWDSSVQGVVFELSLIGDMGEMDIPGGRSYMSGAQRKTQSLLEENKYPIIISVLV